MSLEDLIEQSASVGSKTISKIEATPGTIYVIDKKQIKKINAQNLKDVLNVYVPGLEALPTLFKYGNSSTGIYNRGVLSDFNQQILILWNGQNKFNDATFGSPHLMMEYPLDNVEQIEINSSSPSPLLGGSAMMTINIITTDQKSTTNEAYVITGFSESNGLLSKRISTNFHNSLNEWRIAGALQYFDDLGFTYNQDVKNSSVYKLRNGNKGSVSMQWNIQSPNKKIELGSSYRNINKDAFLSNLVYRACS